MVWTSAWAGCNAGYSFIQIKKSVRVFTNAFSPKRRRFFRTCQIAIKFSQQIETLYMYVNTKKTESHIIISYAFENHVSCRCKRRRKDEDTEELANKRFSLKKAVDTVSVHRNHGSQHRNSWRRNKTRHSFAVRLKQIAFLSRRNCKKVKIIFAWCLC